MDRIYRLQHAMEAVTAAQVGILVHTLMGAGVREWCYYTNDYATFEARFNEVCKDLPLMPIELSFQKDSEWKYWQSMKLLPEGGGSANE